MSIILNGNVISSNALFCSYFLRSSSAACLWNEIFGWLQVRLSQHGCTLKESSVLLCASTVILEYRVDCRGR